MFLENIESLMTLLQNVSKGCVGSGGGDGGVNCCVGGGCVAVGGVGGEGGGVGGDGVGDGRGSGSGAGLVVFGGGGVCGVECFGGGSYHHISPQYHLY